MEAPELEKDQTPDGNVVVAGSIVAQPTLFSSGALHLRDLDSLIRFQSRQATSGLLVAGSVGEGWSLSSDELGRLVGRAVESAARHSAFRQHVYAGISQIDSNRARDAAITAVHAGAEALFLHAPSFVRATDEGLVRHFQFIAEGLPTRTPLVLVNEPMRTGTDLHPALARRIFRAIPQFVAHCEGIGHPTRARTLASELPVPLLCSDDRMIGPYVRNGAVGALSAVAGLVPAEVARLIVEAQSSGVRAARIADGLERNLAPLVDALRVATSPVGLKEALFALEAIQSAEMRPPLARLGDQEQLAMRRALFNARLLIPEPQASRRA
ncbi:MAG: dihydrodipicolinate synthase family protein [Planctomycetota bacterium]